MGDQVSLKLQLYVQSSLVKQTNHKLAFNFFGPYPVIAKVGLTAYKLGLPASCNLHLVFHVSPLKKDVGSSCQVSSSLPIFSYHLQWSEAVLQCKCISTPDGPSHQLLIKWSSWLVGLVTWQNETAIKEQFPHTMAWGQADLKRGEYVTQPEVNSGDQKG